MIHFSLKALLIIAMISLLTGCIATHYGNMAGSASLGSPNFVYQTQNLIGEAKATYILGIGGVARQSLVAEAKKDMLKNHPLKANQALANLSVSHKTTGFLGFIVTTVICTVSADIVEFGRAQNDHSQASPSEGLNEPAAEKGSQIQPGEQVWIVNYFQKPVEGKLIHVQKGRYIVEYKTSGNKTRTASLLEYQVERK